MDNKYSYKNFLKQLIDNSRKKGFNGNTREEFIQWQYDFKLILSNVLGLYNLPNFSYKIEFEKGEVSADNHIRSKFILETLPNVFMPVLKLMPNNPNGKTAIALPCHGSNKETTCGVGDTPEHIEKIAQYPDRAYALQLVNQGYTVYCPDQIGAGERATDPSNYLNGNCFDIANAALGIGLTYSGLYINDLIKLIDYISDTAGNTDLSCVGFSGGGLHAMYLAALDDRVDKCVISGYLHNYYNSVLDTHGCSCNFVPKIWGLCDMADIVSMIAPRPLFIENGTEDRLNGILGIDDPISECEKPKKVYELFDASDKIVHYTFEGGHQFSGKCFEFLNKF